MKIHSLNPDGLAAHFELYRTAMRSTRTLPKVDREMIAVVVSVANELPLLSGAPPARSAPSALR